MPASGGVLAFGLFVSVIVFYLAWMRPTIALTVWLIFSTIFSEYILLPNAPTLHVHLRSVLLTALLLGLALGWVPMGRPREAPVAPAALIFILAIWTLVVSAITGTIHQEDAGKNVSVFVSGFVIPGAALYFGRYFPLTLKTARTVCALFTGLLVYLVFTTFCEHFHIDSLIFPGFITDPAYGVAVHIERARGPILNSAADGGILAMLLLIGLHWFLYATNGLTRWVAVAATMGLGSAALFFTETRGPWLAFAGGLAVMLLHSRMRGTVLAMSGMGAMALVVYMMATGSVGQLVKKDPLPQRSDNTAETATFRVDLYKESVRPFLTHPLIGWGLGKFTDEEHFFNEWGSGSLTINWAVLHDTLDAITLESGVVGGLLWLGFLITLVTSLLRLRRMSTTFEARDFYVVGLSTIAAFEINGSFVDVRYFMQHNALMFFICGLGLGLSPRAGRVDAPPMKGADRQANRFAMPWAGEWRIVTYRF